MDQEELFRRLAVSLAIGLLVGLERGWQTREESDHQRTAGFRTFALTGLLGGICGLMSALSSSPFVLAAGLFAFTGALVTFSYLEAAAEKNFSVTGVVAGILTFVLGAYATLGNETVAVAAAVAMAILLALREPLHSWVRNVTWPEMRSVLVLLAMSFLLLPILPNRPVDPWQVLNPLGNLAARHPHRRRLVCRLHRRARPGRSQGRRRRRHCRQPGLLDGNHALLCPTGARAPAGHAPARKRDPAGRRHYDGAHRRAGGRPQARARCCAHLAECAAAAVLLAGTAMLSLWRRQGGAEHPQLQIKNPFDLGTVLQLAGLIAVILLLAKLVAAQAGNAGLFLLAAISGIADVDALTLSMARLSGVRGVGSGCGHSYPGRGLGQHRVKGHDCRLRGWDAARKHRRGRERARNWPPWASRS